jgi:hypothetical protein
MKANEGEIPQYYVENSPPPSCLLRLLNWCRKSFEDEKPEADIPVA